MNNYIKLKNIHKPVSRIGLGCWSIGGGPAWGGDKDMATVLETIRSCPDIGVTLMDTAPAYNFGQSERIIGEALRCMDREQVVITTKFGIVWDRLGAPFVKVGDTPQYKNLSPESIIEEIDRSLDRLQTDYIDVYISHWQSIEPYFTPIQETVACLNELKQQGKIKAIGAANVNMEHIHEYEKYGDLDLVQVKYSILDRGIEKDVLPYCQKHQIAVQVYSPLEQGLLTGKVSRKYQPVGSQKTKKWFQPDTMPKALDFVDALRPLCEKYQCTIPNLVMGWLLAQSENITILSGASSSSHLSANMRAAELMFDPDDLAFMRAQAEALDS